MESSKYRFCAWKWCGPRYMPSDQTTLESSLIGVGIQCITFSDRRTRRISGCVPVAARKHEKIVLDRRPGPSAGRGPQRTSTTCPQVRRLYVAIGRPVRMASEGRGGRGYEFLSEVRIN